jgi:hypothetical protein
VSFKWWVSNPPELFSWSFEGLNVGVVRLFELTDLEFESPQLKDKRVSLGPSS